MDEKIKKSNGETAIEGAAEEPSTPGAEEQALASELEKLRGQLEAKEMEAKGNYDRFLRQVAELENLTLQGEATHGIGNDKDNVLQGGTWLEGKDGNDTLSLSGNGVLDGGTGNDTLYGAAGNDTY
ncbi:MAG: hypothetical protein AABZ66_04245, partial [Candidatus Binatota bacterium]